MIVTSPAHPSTVTAVFDGGLELIGQADRQTRSISLARDGLVRCSVLDVQQTGRGIAVARASTARAAVRKKREVNARQRRDDLIEATIHCVAEFGIAGASVERIGAAAGVSRSLFRHYFGSKNQLLVEAFQRLADEFRAVHGEVGAESEDPEAELRSLIQRTVNGPLFSPDRVHAWFGFWHAARTNPDLQRINEAVYALERERYRRLLQAAAEKRGRDLDAKQAGNALAALADGVWLEFLVDAPAAGIHDFTAVDAEDIINLFIDYILGGDGVDSADSSHDVLGTMLARRSIRRFTDEPITSDQEQLLLAAAFSGPSSTNSRVWHFVVIRDAAKRAALAGMHDYTAMLRNAPLVIAVLGHPSSAWWIEDCSAATENILLEATQLGLGSIWCGVRQPEGDEDEYFPLLGVPPGSGWRVLSLVGVGHPAERKKPRTQYESTKVSYETFGRHKGRPGG